MYYSTEVKEAAKRLFLRRHKAKEIQAQLNLPNIRIVYHWIRVGGWEDMLTDEEPLTAVSRRITLLLEKADSLTKGELDELDRLTTVRERLVKQCVKPVAAPIRDDQDDDGHRRDDQRGERRESGKRDGKKREKKVKNDVSELREVDFLDKFISKMYGYQKELFAAKQNLLTARIRNILKSRQVGLTYYFAGEAFMDAVLTGDNQVFLSASRAQSEIFRSYIIAFAQAWFGLELTGNPIVRKLSFTGSTDIGRQLMAECAKDIKKVSLELGGNAPFIVFDDADLDKAVEGAMISKYRNNGQTCVCANRIYVQDAVYDAFAEKLKAAVGKLKIGNGLEEGVTTGPLIDDKAVAKVKEHIADAVSKGATVLTGGNSLEGSFFEPTILVNVSKDAAVAREETFGPLAPLFRFKDEAEVIAMANDTEFGLASYFYAQNMSRVFRVAEALEYGMVGINTGLISNELAPFGGIKSSGLGREGSKYGIEDYLEIKYLCLSV
ncbi:aldehyde dehydrogenase family protein [Pseudomonas syringae]|nr:aldehyde dehydrogenase family protein [Pseudomonas syringae]